MSATLSRKNRERARTTRPLHQTTKAQSTGISETVASTPRIKPGKSDIWLDADVDLSIFPNRDMVMSPPSDNEDVNIDLAVEIFRADKISQHRQHFTDLCKAHQLPAPIYAWERWQARCKLLDILQRDSDFTADFADEVLPRDSKSVDEGIIADLVRASFTEPAARQISRALSEQSENFVKDIATYYREVITDPSRHASRVDVLKHKHTSDFTCASCRHKLLKLNNTHYTRLKQQYLRNLNQTFDEDIFHKRVYIVLSRYRSLLGHGFQAALNEHSFRVLHDHFDVKFECFASPLNSTYNKYCSAFPLVDRYFGSVNNFFSIKPTSGSFEANPPFIPEVMTAMCTHITTLLRDATGPMSFVVIVPGWADDPAWRALSTCAYKRQCYIVAASDHGYCDGAQHQRQDRYRESTYDTGVFILQNNLGAQKWPAGPLIESALRMAMAQALPTEMMKIRRLRDGRGHADQDGGGGVYKGRKKNKRKRTEDGALEGKAADSDRAMKKRKKKISKGKIGS